MNITTEKDKYGNILRHLTQDGEYIREIIYQYNHQGDMISRENYDNNGVLLDKNIAHNEYDSEGNVCYKKDTLYLYDIITKNVIRTHVTEHFYDNIYDANGLLVEVICSYQTPPVKNDDSQGTANPIEKIISYKEKYYYHNTLLIKKEHINYNKTRTPVNISTYQYDNHNKIKEEQVYLGNEVLSHYISYKHIEEKRYYKTIIGPSKTHHSWTIDEVVDTRCDITLYDSCCTTELIEEVLAYIVKTYIMVKEIIISLNTAQDYTYHEEVDKKLREYQDIHNLWIGLIP